MTKVFEKDSRYRSRTGKCGDARTTAPERSEGHRVPVQKEGRGGADVRNGSLEKTKRGGDEIRRGGLQRGFG